MNAKKILVPVDFSTGSETALDLATSLARDSGAKLLITYVEVPPLPVGCGELMYIEPTTPTEAFRARLARVLPKDPNIPVEHSPPPGQKVYVTYAHRHQTTRLPAL